MQRPLCTIIIPTYNHGKYIERSIQCALDQTYPNVEIIIIDDGSTDDTRARLQQFGSRIVYHRKENAGLGAARNTGIELSNGEYLQFLDADDCIAPEKLERQVSILDAHCELAVVYSDCSCTDHDGRPIENTSHPLSETDSALAVLVRRNLFSVHAALVRRSWVIDAGLFDVSRVAQEDWELWLQISLLGGLFRYVPGNHSHYDQTGSEMTNNPVLMYRRMKHLLEKFRDDKNVLTNEALRADLIAYQNLDLATRAYNNRWWNLARSHFLEAARANSDVMNTKYWSCIPKSILHQLTDFAAGRLAVTPENL